MNCLTCQKETKNPKFCSQSCAAIHTNKHMIRKGVQGKCKICNAPIMKSRTYCKNCYNDQKNHIGGRSKKLPITFCPNCQKQVSSGNKFCNKECSIEYKFQQTVKLVESQGYFYEYRTHTNAPFVKKYLKYKYGNKCAICGIDAIWNGKSITLITDHINGHHNDWSLDNIRLVCPNCDSQLPTYKSKNKGNGRKNRVW
jgi:DNA replicative helicase MCM subunit Mcm2 (Cdc46/Mcm family)